MAINLTVILGAGAAHDVINPQSNDAIDFPRIRYRPPITANLFDTSIDWEHEYNKFKKVASVIGELRNAYPSKRTSLNIETFLKGLRNSHKKHRNDQFREFPLYLQHYFAAVSDRYCRKPSNYMILINKIFDIDLGKVIFVTTNYDLLFDKALESYSNFTKSDPNMNKYISDERWAYIKLHGSVDWGRRIKESMVKNTSSTLPGLLDNVSQLGATLDEALETDIVIDKRFNQETKELIYPAISVPVGESKLNCRDEHIATLKEHLNNCQNFLIIGFSGYDEDVLRFLDEKNGGFGKVLIVSGSKDSARETVTKFFSFGGLGGKLQGHVDSYLGNGFDEFIRSSVDLNEYLKNLL